MFIKYNFNFVDLYPLNKMQYVVDFRMSINARQKDEIKISYFSPRDKTDDKGADSSYLAPV